jgi:hypothetical protein
MDLEAAMEFCTSSQEALEPEIQEFYCHVLTALRAAAVPFLAGGAYVLECYTGIVRHTKDLDIFVRPRDNDHILATLAAAGYRTEHTFPHWLSKAFQGENVIDIIYRSGNSIAEVDDAWFDYAVEGQVMGIPVRLCPPEEIIWSKAFIMERERYDGHDIVHLLRACGETLDWPRLLQRFGPHWRVLISHLILYGFVYPAEQSRIPSWVMEELLGRLQRELAGPLPTERLCQGTLLSREQYLVDIERWGYQDARLQPRGPMTPEDVAQWTAAIEGEEVGE